MKYLTGIVALSVACDLDSCGLWQTPREEFTTNLDSYVRESESSILGTLGIEKDKIIPYNGNTLYNVANHARAYCDLVAEKRYKALDGLFFDAIQDTKTRMLIFEYIFKNRTKFKNYKEINRFMHSEFGNAWDSYVSSYSSIQKTKNAIAKKKEEIDNARRELYGTDGEDGQGIEGGDES